MNAPYSTRSPALRLGWRKPPSRPAFGFKTCDAVEPSDLEDALIEAGGESHTMVLASTGKGKGRSVIIPNLLTYEGSAIVLDVKGEAAEVTARRRREMGQEVYLLDPWRKRTKNPDTLNPFDIFRPDDPDADDHAAMLAELIIARGPSERDPFWDTMARLVLSGLISLFSAPGASAEERTLASVRRMLMKDAGIYDIARRLDTQADVSEMARENLGHFLQISANVTRDGILASTAQYLTIFGTRALRLALGSSTIDLDLLRSGAPVTIYIIVPPEKLESHAPLVRLWLGVLLTAIMQREQRPGTPTLLVLDELAQLGSMTLIPKAVTLLRGYGVRAMLFLQGLSQLEKNYPVEHKAILANCGSVLTFGHDLLSNSAEVADALGDIGADEMFAMKKAEGALHLSGERTEVVTLLDYLHDPLFEGLYDRNSFFSEHDAPQR